MTKNGLIYQKNNLSKGAGVYMAFALKAYFVIPSERLGSLTRIRNLEIVLSPEKASLKVRKFDFERGADKRLNAAVGMLKMAKCRRDFPLAYFTS